MTHSTKKLVFMHIAILLGILLFVTLLTVFKIGCPIRYATGIPCPTCGSTRAIIALFKLDIMASLRYHPFVVPIIIAVFLGLHSNTNIVKHKKAAETYIISTAAITMVIYIFRLFTNTIL